MTQLIECIPNFSEARRPEIIDQIAAEVKEDEGLVWSILFQIFLFISKE
jgi:glutamate formiminotransferase